MPSLSFSLLLLLSLLSCSSAQTTTTAAIILSASGYKSMSLALNLAADSLSRLPPSLTVLAPTDAAFAAAAGQPSLKLLRFHILPAAVPLRSLKSLPSDSKIATLLPGSFITVTTVTSGEVVVVSVNNVTAWPVYEDEDGGLVILGVEQFLSISDENTPARVESAEGLGDTTPGAKGGESSCVSLEQLLKAIDTNVPRRDLSGDTPPGANQGKCVSCCRSDRVTFRDVVVGFIYSVIGSILMAAALFSYKLLCGKAPGFPNQNQDQNQAVQVVPNPNGNQAQAVQVVPNPNGNQAQALQMVPNPNGNQAQALQNQNQAQALPNQNQAQAQALNMPVFG